MKFRDGIQGIFKSRGMLHLIALMAMICYTLEVSADYEVTAYPSSVETNRVTFSFSNGLDSGKFWATIEGNMPTLSDGKFVWNHDQNATMRINFEEGVLQDYEVYSFEGGNYIYSPSEADIRTLYGNDSYGIGYGEEDDCEFSHDNLNYIGLQIQTNGAGISLSSIKIRFTHLPFFIMGVNDYTYDGTTKSQNNFAVKARISALTMPSDYYTISGTTSATEAGTYSFSVTGKNGCTGTVEETWTISKGASSVTSAPTAKALAYTGAAQQLINAGSGTGGEMQYKLGSSGIYSATIPQATAAGTYTVYYKIVGDKNHNDSSEGQVSVTIGKKEVSLSWDNTNLPYNRTAQKPTCTAGGLINGDNCTVTVSGEQTDAGSNYTATATELSNANYKLPSGVTQSFTITPVVAELSWANTTLTYTGENQLPTCTVSNLIGEDECNVTVSLTGGDKKNAGSYTATAGTLSNSNYKLPSANTTQFTISPIEVGLDWGETSLPYTGNAQAPTCEATGVLSGESCEVTVTGQATEAGSHTATASSLNNSNYKLPEANTTEFTITALAATVSFGENPDETKDYGDDNYTKTATKTGDGTIGYTSGNTDVAEVDAETGEVTIKAAGEAVITATVTGNTNYSYATATATYTLTVNKVAATCTTAPTGKTLDWTGEAQVLVEAGSADGGEMQYRLGDGSYGTDIPTATEPGSYTIYYKVVGDGNHNDVAEQSVSASITKALDPSTDASVTVTSTATSGNPAAFIATYAYDGSAHVPEIVVKDGETVIPTTIVYKNSSNVEVAAADITALGTYTAEITFGGNYSGSTTAQFEIYLTGDATGDNVADGIDFVALINHVLGTGTGSFRSYAADLDGDGVVDVQDAMLMIDLLLGNGSGSARRKVAAAEERQELEVQ